jgi:FkbM family methyltransferase
MNNLNDRVHVFNKAVGHSPGRFTLRSLGTQTCGSGYNTGGIGFGHGGEEVEIIALDQMNLPGVDFMKVDVEGAEGLVFRGAARTILKYRPVILFEQNSQRVDPNEIGIPVPTPFEALTELGYNTFYHIGNANYISY